jgi:hypothetical protein
LPRGSQAGTLRERLAAQRPSFAERRAVWYQLVDSDVLALLHQGNRGPRAKRGTELLAPSLVLFDVPHAFDVLEVLVLSPERCSVRACGGQDSIPTSRKSPPRSYGISVAFQSGINTL